MIRRAMLVVILFAPQDADQWIDDLRSDDLAKREAAEQKLVEAGPAVLPKLEPLEKSADADLRARASRVVSTIRLNVRRAAVFGPVVKVTLDFKEMPFREALAQLEKKSGFQLWVAKDVEDRPITLALTDAPWLDAVSRLCRAHGDVRLRDVEYENDLREFFAWREADPAHRGAFALVRGKTTSEPAVCDGPFRISLARLELACSNRHDRFTLEFRRTWQPNVRPMGVGGPVFDLLSDDGTRDLSRESSWRGYHGFPASDFPGTYRGATAVLWISALPDRAADKLAVVRGRATIWFGLETGPVAIENPAEKVGTKVSVGDFAVTLEKFTDTGQEISIRARPSCKENFQWKGGDGRPEDLIRFDFLDGEGKAVPISVLGSNSTGQIDFSFQTQEGRTIRKIEMHSWSDIWKVEVPFEFKDVPLPKW